MEAFFGMIEGEEERRSMRVSNMTPLGFFPVDEKDGIEGGGGERGRSV
jgi:hypothetical protein